VELCLHSSSCLHGTPRKKFVFTQILHFFAELYLHNSADTIGFINTTLLSVMSVRKIVVRKMRKNSFRECLSARVNHPSSVPCACRHFVWHNTAGNLWCCCGHGSNREHLSDSLASASNWMSFLCCPCARLFYHIENLHPPAYSMSAAVLKDTMKETIFYKWVPVTTAWRVLSLRMEERPPMWRVAANILNKQSRKADKRWSSSLGVGCGANNSSP